MGKAMAMFGLWMIVCALSLTYQESISALSPEVTLSNAIFNDNALVGYLDTSGNVTTFNNTLGGSLPQSSPTGTAGSSSNFPDWTNSVITWVGGIGGAIVDFIGTPYFLFMWMFPGSDAAIWGGLLSIINLVLIVGWLTGRID